MNKVRETKLPGIGVRHEFTSDEDQTIGVLVHHDGRREVLVYDDDDPDACTSIMRLSSDDTRTLSELLGGTQVIEEVGLVQHPIEGLLMEWMSVAPAGPATGTTIGAGEFRSRTGASLVAVIRAGDSIPAPGPEFVLEAGDTVVAVGTSEGLSLLRPILSP